MTFVNYVSREVNFKVVFYGPELCGKTDNLQFLYKKTNSSAKGKLVTLATETDRTMFVDLLLLEHGSIGGFKLRFHLYTVPGQALYDASRQLILRGVDGVIFVADSRRERMDENLESLRNLQRDLEHQGYDLRSIPYVLQLNKRDSPMAVPVEEMMARLRIADEPVLEAVAHSEDGIGVLDTLKALAKLVSEEVTKVDEAPGSAFSSFFRSRRQPDLPRPAAPFDKCPRRSDPAPPVRSRRLSEGGKREQPPITFKPDAPLSHEIRFETARGFPGQDLVALLLFPYAFLVGSALFIAPGATQHFILNAAYWIAGVGGALWIHRRNERHRLAAA
jgi:hypothetical protein